MDKLFIPIIEGTTRPERESIKVAKFILEVSKQFEEIEAVLVDPAELNLPQDGVDIKDPKFSEITASADGFIIVVPEYNHHISGSLKRLLDSEFENYKYKPVLLAGVSSGQWGGVRAVESIAPLMKALNLMTFRNDLYFPKVQELFNDDGSIKEEEYTERTEKLLKEFLWLTKTMKYGRENLK
jgi:NAD(P)H-dependent FMN reductase